MNNYEKIKNMSIDEMVEFLIICDCYYCNASDCEVWKDKEPFTDEKIYKITNILYFLVANVITNINTNITIESEER